MGRSTARKQHNTVATVVDLTVPLTFAARRRMRPRLRQQAITELMIVVPVEHLFRH
jgi:hypothetical protein